MPVHLLKPLLLPLLILVVVNLAAIAWRAIPQGSDNAVQEADWQTLELPMGSPDVRQGLLVGGQWGLPIIDDEEQSAAADSDIETEEDAVIGVEALGRNIQRQLQGIIHRGEWILLFAQSEPALAAETNTSAENTILPLLIELRSGDSLPDTPWYIGEVWADRIQLVQEGHDPLIVPLYPIAESVTEP